MNMRERSRSGDRDRSGERRERASAGGAERPRWWRWRSWRTLRHHDAEADAVDEGDASWYLRLDHVCQQVAAYLPSVSISTRKAIFWCVALLVAWRVILWALEMLVTSVCFAVALLIVVCFLRPDVALVLLTEVLPPYLDAARGWLSATFLSAGLSLTRRPLIVPTPAAASEALAIEDNPAPPPILTPVQCRPRTIHPRPRHADSEPVLIEAAA